jgi:LPPG:FO 2-phospho-L-lactate transferase
MSRRSGMIGVICGGSGSSKFARALSKYSRSNQAKRVGFVANVGDNFWFHGLYVCPDIDILLYALSGKLDVTKGWGRAGDTFNFLKAYSESSGRREWFQMGDKDLALTLRRTELLHGGTSLSGITDSFRRAFSIQEAVYPATDDSVETFIRTHEGRMHLQEFWVRRHGHPKILGIEYAGIEKAKPNAKALGILGSNVVICPANPITSIGPTIKLKGVEQKLKSAKVVAVSPFVGGKIVSGPAARMMKAKGIEASSFGVAMIYSDFLDVMLVDESEEESVVRKIRSIGAEVIKTRTIIRSPLDGESIAREICGLF